MRFAGRENVPTEVTLGKRCYFGKCFLPVVESIFGGIDELHHDFSTTNDVRVVRSEGHKDGDLLEILWFMVEH